MRRMNAFCLGIRAIREHSRPKVSPSRPNRLKLIRNPLFLLLMDALLINGCILTTFSIRFFGLVPARNIHAYHNTWPYITAVFILLFYMQGLYDYSEDDDGPGIFFRVSGSVTMGTISVIALTFISRDFAFPRTVFMISYAVMLVAFNVWRIVVQDRYLASLPVRNVALFGAPARTDALKSHILNEPRRRFSVIGTFVPDTAASLRDTLDAGRADCVILTDEVPGIRSLGFDIFLKHPDVSVYMVPAVHDIIIGALHHTVLGDVPLISMSQKTILGRLLLMKRIMDILVSSFVLALVSPIIFGAAALMVLTSRGPAFYTQERVGRNGRLFRIIKLRTMVADAEKHTGPMLSAGGDPRITTVGRFLRRSKIDELPQFVNVLFGQMSIVGPRPERPEFVADFEARIPAYAERKKVLPGITGLAQISGLYASDPEMKLKYDLLYIYNYQPLMDPAIVYRTLQLVVRQVLFARDIP